MSSLCGPFDGIKDISLVREAWRLKVRVIRVWELCKTNDPSNVFSVEMVLLDAEGERIQASIRKGMIKKFKNCVVEGGVYKMTYFNVVENKGEYRGAFHEFKLLFQPRTKVIPTESELIPRFGVNAKTSQQIQQTNGKSDYLYDFIGVLTAVGEEKQFKKFGRDIRVLELELTDDKGLVKCSLFGHFIDIMKDFLVNGMDDLGILVIQFAKVKEYLGEVSLQTVSNSTRLLWNPQIPEAISFKNGIVCNGMDFHAPIKIMGQDHFSYSFTEDFLTHFPRKTVEDLHLTEEEGYFICCANVEGIVKNDFRWYMACKCHRSVNSNDDGTYYCSRCEGFVTDVTPRYRLKLEVSDPTESAHFVIFDYDAASLISKSCATMVGDEKVPSRDYPAELDKIIGKELLFKIEVKNDRALKFDDSFKVRRICDDEEIIKEFKDQSSVKTPEMLKLKVPVEELFDDDVPAGDDAQGSEAVHLSKLYNEAEITSPAVGESSSAAACLAPQKRKCPARLGRGGLAKKCGNPRALKIEKD